MKNRRTSNDTYLQYRLSSIGGSYQLVRRLLLGRNYALLLSRV